MMMLMMMMITMMTEQFPEINTVKRITCVLCIIITDRHHCFCINNIIMITIAGATNMVVT